MLTLSKFFFFFLNWTTNKKAEGQFRAQALFVQIFQIWNAYRPIFVEFSFSVKIYILFGMHVFFLPYWRINRAVSSCIDWSDSDSLVMLLRTSFEYLFFKSLSITNLIRFFASFNIVVINLFSFFLADN